MQGFDFSAMNYVDYISLIIIFISICFGFYRGFVTSAVSLMGWVLSIILTYQLYPTIEQHLLNYMKSKVFVIILGSGGLLILLLVVFGILNTVFYKLIGDLKRSFFDRMMGVLFGLVGVSLSIDIVRNILIKKHNKRKLKHFFGFAKSFCSPI